ncbi:MAG: patatin-like phospholipase family protein, partial [Bacteroidales bacterium]|nr:patatin-like phospholipase family protein [Bacteroidales bacterium]
MNARMDSIRRHRPTVAVVLSGGGAKGAAHIGLLKYLEEIDMPIDMVLGTSMGGLVGGIYAMGYSASQLDSMIRSFDWDLLMSDKISKDYIPFEEKRYRETFLLSVPFHYRESDYNENRTASKRYPKPEQLTFKAGENEYTSRTESNFLSSLPAGYLVGQNIYSVF